MTTPLVAILGAGASRGCGEFDEQIWQPTLDVRIPPLTVDLFDESKYGQVLRKYDLAHQAGRFIAEERAQNDALGLEAALHLLSTSTYAHHRHMAIAVPPYLQDLLFAVGELYPAALYYDRLIERLLRLPYVFFVSLNYDLILDRRLSAHRHLSDFDSYISDDKNWSLIKPHGSVNWWHEASEVYISEAPPATLQWDPASFSCVPPETDRSTLFPQEFANPGITARYPALAAPEGPDDRLVLPAEHNDFFFDGLHKAHEVDVLVVGYSGLDREILGVIKRAGPKIRHMTTVSHHLIEAEKVVARFREAGLEPLWHEPVDGDFKSWSDGGGLNRLVEEYGGPYPRAR